MRTVFLGWCAVASLLALLLYAWDKAAARRGGRRVPESPLLLIGLTGGGPGALLGMLLFRHKTRRLGFWVANLIGLSLALEAASQAIGSWR